MFLKFLPFYDNTNESYSSSSGVRLAQDTSNNISFLFDSSVDDNLLIILAFLRLILDSLSLINNLHLRAVMSNISSIIYVYVKCNLLLPN